MKIFDLASEKKILSNILHGNEKIDYSKVFSDLSTDHFTTEKTKLLFKILQSYFLENSELPTLSIVKRKIKRELKKIKKKDKEKGYIVFINKLSRMKKYKQSQFDFFCSELTTFEKIRKNFNLLEVASDMLEDGKHPDSISDYIAREVLNNGSADGSVRIIDYRDHLNDRIKEVRKKRKEGGRSVGTVYTGIEKLDQEMGGIDPGEIFVAAGATGRGKSILLEHIAAYNILNGNKVVMFTNEMKAEQIAYRIDSNLTEIKHRKFERANLSKLQIKKWRADVKSLVKSGQLKIIEIYQGCSTNHIEDLLRKSKMNADILIVDYAQRMSPSFSKQKSSDLDWTSVGTVVRELKNLALKLPMPLATAVQLRPNAAEKDKLHLGDIALSPTVINSEADFLIGIILTDKMKMMAKGYLQIMKCRQGAEKEMIAFRPNYNLIRLDDVE